MPTIRPTKRLLLPLDTRLRRIVEQVIFDQSELMGVSTSDAIIRDILDSHLPKTEFARSYAEAVFAGDNTVLKSVARVLHTNTAGSIGEVKHREYKRIVEFGLDLIDLKDLTTALDTQHPDSPHLRNRFEGLVDGLERTLGERGGETADYELYRKVEYGRALLDEANPELFSRAPARAYVTYALESFDVVGPWNTTCGFLADLFNVLSDVERHMGGGPSFVPPDTAALRRAWVRTLVENCADW